MLFFCGAQPKSGMGRLVFELPKSHTITYTPLNKWPLCRRLGYLRNTTNKTDQHSYPQRDSHPRPSNQATADLRLVPHDLPEIVLYGWVMYQIGNQVIPFAPLRSTGPLRGNPCGFSLQLLSPFPLSTPLPLFKFSCLSQPSSSFSVFLFYVVLVLPTKNLLCYNE